jgi:hypothetical protein
VWPTAWVQDDPHLADILIRDGWVSGFIDFGTSLRVIPPPT